MQSNAFYVSKARRLAAVSLIVWLACAGTLFAQDTDMSVSASGNRDETTRAG